MHHFFYQLLTLPLLSVAAAAGAPDALLETNPVADWSSIPPALSPCGHGGPLVGWGGGPETEAGSAAVCPRVPASYAAAPAAPGGAAAPERHPGLSMSQCVKT